jgi:hypothetical protein
LDDLVAVDWFLGYLVEDVVTEEAFGCAVEPIVGDGAIVFLGL